MSTKLRTTIQKNKKNIEKKVKIWYNIIEKSIVKIRKNKTV